VAPAEESPLAPGGRTSLSPGGARSVAGGEPVGVDENSWRKDQVLGRGEFCERESVGSVRVRDATYLGMRLYLLVSSPSRPAAFSSQTPQEPANIS
jgi:hypothetical protein